MAVQRAQPWPAERFPASRGGAGGLRGGSRAAHWDPPGVPAGSGVNCGAANQPHACFTPSPGGVGAQPGCGGLKALQPRGQGTVAPSPPAAAAGLALQTRICKQKRYLLLGWFFFFFSFFLKERSKVL